MIQPEAVFFDCDGTLVDSEYLCSKAYVHMFAHYGVHLSLDRVFKEFKGVKLYEIIERINKQFVSELEAKGASEDQIKRMLILTDDEHPVVRMA